MDDTISNEEHTRLVSLARIWLAGYAHQVGDAFERRNLEDDTPLDRECRRALAQLLIDRSAPGEILDLLAVHIAPTMKLAPSLKRPKTGEPLTRSGLHVVDLALEGHDWTLRRTRRDNKRQTDSLLASSILTMLLEATDSGKSVESACFEVSERLSDAGMSKVSARNIRRIWDDAKPLRDYRKRDAFRPSD